MATELTRDFGQVNPSERETIRVFDDTQPLETEHPTNQSTDTDKQFINFIANESHDTRDDTRGDENTRTSYKNDPRNYKGKRGRPFGYSPKNKEGDTTDVATITQEKSYVGDRPKRGRPSKKQNLMSADEAQQITAVILEVVESFGVSTLGENAKFNPIERLSLETCLPKYLSSMKTETLEKANAFIYPIGVIVGFGSYGVRCFRLAKEKESIRQEIMREMSQGQANWNGQVPLYNEEQDENLSQMSEDNSANQDILNRMLKNNRGV